MPTINPRPRTNRSRNTSAHQGASEVTERPFERHSSIPASTSTAPEAGPDSIAESERLIMAGVPRPASAATRGDYNVRAGKGQPRPPGPEARRVRRSPTPGARRQKL